MAREIIEHRVTGLDTVNESLTVTAVSDPDPLGQTRFYEIAGPAFVNPTEIVFQSRPRKEVGFIDGITEEALLAIVLDRLRGRQTGPLKDRQVEWAIDRIYEGLHNLHLWATARSERKIEGTSTPSF
jgi:hypothetical protein